VRSSQADVYFAALNRAFRDLPRQFPGVTYVESDTALNGFGATSYHEVLKLPDGSWVRTRMTDGLHLCPAGAALLGQTVSQVIHDRFAAPLTPGWQDGPWRTDSVYLPASCPPP
jgi:hypothetical protein